MRGRLRRQLHVVERVAAAYQASCSWLECSMRGVCPLIVLGRKVTCRDSFKSFQLCSFIYFQKDIHTTHAKRMPQFKNKKKNDVPDRWTDYQAVGKRIPGTRFIAFKVPLKESLRNRLPPSEAFGPNDLLQHVLVNEEQQLGLIIDLTFTTRYYKPQDFPEYVHYVKIFTAGHEVPSDPTILSFKRAVRRFLRENEDNDDLIGVHCTHGLNRTGYLVCRYLIDVDGIEPEKAIELFNTSRGHDIERENYVNDLQQGPKRSNEGMEEPEPDPDPEPEPRQRFPNQRQHRPPLNQSQAPQHNQPFRNPRNWLGDRDGPYGNSFRPPPPHWEMNRGFNGGGPGLLPPPPAFFQGGAGLYPDPPPFLRFPQQPQFSDWDRRGPPRPGPPRYPPQLPRYRFGGPDEDDGGGMGDRGRKQDTRGPHRRQRDRSHRHTHKHGKRDHLT
ncbi:RNA/RNP complex-1-interacting phosphatase isoform X2 [Engraulis encrasicolus]|uniref:RNA/RNP complex-1-interacting phosphatase isoform X2 n=1 Tax=Engraulis encrasicolus TaxID=184585 RepID=UPI002FD33060